MFDSISKSLKILRFFMVLSSISPLFLLWVLRAPEVVPNEYCSWFRIFCFCMIVVPNLILWWRVQTVEKDDDRDELVVGGVRDHKDSIVVYFFTIMLPLYSVDIMTLPDLYATLAALFIIIFIFYHLNLYYVNILFTFLGYYIFTIEPPVNDNPYSDKASKVLIAKKDALFPNQRITAYRLSNGIYIEL